MKNQLEKPQNHTKEKTDVNNGTKLEKPTLTHKLTSEADKPNQDPQQPHAAAAYTPSQPDHHAKRHSKYQYGESPNNK
ncbi:hypothetical protein LIER_00097 [Lithospermum erythrorhizon]|uniref:Uncharacterized protein n=1 Tax=Lithospermum erythrorhizon TaxID=34254 RepID=A0AAV3NGQ2_LITER